MHSVAIQKSWVVFQMNNEKVIMRFFGLLICKVYWQNVIITVSEYCIIFYCVILNRGIEKQKQSDTLACIE